MTDARSASNQCRLRRFETRKRKLFIGEGGWVHYIHAQSLDHVEHCAELGRWNRLAGSLRFPVRGKLVVSLIGRNPGRTCAKPNFI
jgi:hypothetical protein